MSFFVCVKCGHEWKSRKGVPKKCANPKCATTYWDKPKLAKYSISIDKIKAEKAMKYARMAVGNLQNMYVDDPDWDEAWNYVMKNVSILRKQGGKTNG